jgi:PAS domain S-box-containing protein
MALTQVGGGWKATALPHGRAHFLAAFALVALGIGLAFAPPSADRQWLHTARIIYWIGSHVVAGLLGWLTIENAGQRDRRARSWIAVGLIAYAFGQTIFGVQECLGGQGVLAFQAAIGSLSGACFLVGFLCALFDAVARGRRIPAVLDALSIAIASVAPAFVLLDRSGGPPIGFAGAIAVAQPLVLLGGAAFGLALMMHGRFRLGISPPLFVVALVATGCAWLEWNRRSFPGSAFVAGDLGAWASVCVLALGIGAATWRVLPPQTRQYGWVTRHVAEVWPTIAILVAIAMTALAAFEPDLSPTNKTILFVASGLVTAISGPRQWALTALAKQTLRPSDEADIAAAAANPFGSRLVSLGTWAFDVATGREKLSLEAREIYGIADESLATAENYLPTIDPRDRQGAKEKFDAALAGTRASYSAEFRVQHPSRGERLILDRGWIERDAGGRAIRVFGLVFDVTDLRSMESDLLQSRDRLNLALEETGAGLWEWSALPGAPLTEIEEESAWSLGSTGLEIFDKAYEDRIHPNDRDKGMLWRRKLVSGEADRCEAEFQFRDDTGEWRWILCRGFVTGRDPMGRATRISGVKIDITARKKIEEALRVSQAAMDQTVRRYHQFFNNMRNIIICLGTRGPGEKYFGYDESGVMVLGKDSERISGLILPDSKKGDVARWYNSIHPDDVDNYLELNRRRKEDGEPFEVSFRVVGSPSGEVKWLREMGWTTVDPVSGKVHYDGYLIDITREKTIEAALQESESRYQNAERIAGIFHWVSTTETPGGFATRRVTFSATASMVLLVPKEALDIGADEFLTRFVHADDREWLVGQIEATTKNGEPSMSAEFRVIRGDGQLAHFLANFQFQYGHSGSLALAFGTMQDVTELRRTEQALRQSEELYRQAELAAHLVHWSSSLNDSQSIGLPCPKFSDTAEVLFGVPASEMPSSHDEFLERMIHPSDRDRIRAEVSRAEDLKLTEYPLEYRIQRPDGQTRDVYEVVKDQRDAKGRWVSSFGTMLDVTESRKIAKELQESKARYEAAERIAGLSHWVCEYPENAIGLPNVRFSRTAAAILGIGENELNMTADDFSNRFVHPEDRQRVSDADAAAIGAGKTEAETEYRIVRADGTVRHVQENWRHEFDQHGRAIKSYGAIQDITERKRVEQALRAARSAAESANRAKTQFLANTSHELRTPLNAIIGFSDIMSNEIFGPIGSDAYKKYAQDIHASGQHLLGIINDLLDLSRIEAGETKLSESEIDVFELVSSTTSLLRGRANERGVGLSSGAMQVPITLYADLRFMKQVLINLLSNAIKFTPGGGEVRVNAIETDLGFDLAVTDTGIGMTAEEIATVARPFVQVESWMARKHDGVGLGLAISKSLVELHGGALFIESQKGRGTTVTARLPAGRLVRRQKLA